MVVWKKLKQRFVSRKKVKRIRKAFRKVEKAMKRLEKQRKKRIAYEKGKRPWWY